MVGGLALLIGLTHAAWRHWVNASFYAHVHDAVHRGSIANLQEGPKVR